MTMTATDALAEAWASIDGKIDAFRKERDGWVEIGKLDRDAPGYTGHYEGYLADAGEMTKRLSARGFAIISLTPTDEDVDAMARAMAKANWWDWDGGRNGGCRAVCRVHAHAAYTALLSRCSGGQG